MQVHILGRYAYEASKREMDALLATTATAGSPPSQPPPSQQQQGNKTLDMDMDMDAAAGGGGFGNDDRYKLLSLVYEYFLGTGLRRLKEVGGMMGLGGHVSFVWRH